MTGFKIASLILVLLICFVIGEVGIRYLGNRDADGNFFFFSRTLKPFQFPVLTTKSKIDAYLSSSSSYVVYDSLLGWSLRPNSKSRNGLYNINSKGIRASKEYTILPAKETMRIAIFGDSFTMGDEVPYQETWGYFLEKYLIAEGINAEVINFGVGGFGIDQAYLRYKCIGYKFAPHIVIFGLQPENVNRNINLVRPLYNLNTGIPFSKPRFIKNGDSLKLINVPPVFPGNLVNAIENIEDWDLIEYEFFYNPTDYQNKFYLKSKLVSFVIDLVKINRFNYYEYEKSFYSLNDEPAQLTIRIINEFRNAVEAQGAKYLVVHLPRHGNLSYLLDGKVLAYSAILEEIGENNEVIHTEHEMLTIALSSSLDILFSPKGHYSGKANKIVADVIANFIIAQIRINPEEG